MPLITAADITGFVWDATKSVSTGLVKHKRDTITLTRRDFKTIRGNDWLNDHVINSYLELILIRAQNVAALPSVWIAPSFFYMKYTQKGSVATPVFSVRSRGSSIPCRAGCFAGNY